MYIQTIQLRNFKAYADATFSFPRPGKRKNVVLIGAKNGYGKTSLLEAVLLCLYGKEAIGILPRVALLADDDASKPKLSYDNFMERALHVQAAQFGGPSVSVTVILADEDSSDCLRIERIWHFRADGRHLSGDEDVRLYSGQEQDMVHVPRGEERDDFLRSYVAQHILPASLAKFFLFDGEQVKQLAGRDLAGQVRAGIEGMLGVGILQTLKDDLKSCCRTWRQQASHPGQDRLGQLRMEVQTLEDRIQSDEAQHAILAPQLQQVKSRIDQLLTELRLATGGTVASQEQLLLAKGKLEGERDKLRDTLSHLLHGPLALALIGQPLRKSLSVQLKSEEIRSQWEASQERLRDKFERLAEAVTAGPPAMLDELSAPQCQTLRERLRVGWEALWHPPPQDCASEYLHPYLGPSDRAFVQRRLGNVERLALDEIAEFLRKYRSTEAELQNLANNLSQLSGFGERAKRITEELRTLKDRGQELDKEVGELQRRLESNRAQLANQKRSLGKEEEAERKAKPVLAKVQLAEQIVDLLQRAQEDTMPLHVQEIASAMTQAYRAMAHKRSVHKIEIDASLEVRLLGEGGRDLRDMDSSAGESQIFALSLIAAIASAVKLKLPVIMDTPLARLDKEHRMNVLNYFTDRAGEQVILLTQPNEVHGPYLETIRSRLCARFLIDHEELGDGVGINHVRANDYFEN